MRKLIPLILAFLVLAHHYYLHGKWFEWSDLNSHEMLAVFLLGIWLGIMIMARARATNSLGEENARAYIVV